MGGSQGRGIRRDIVRTSEFTIFFGFHSSGKCSWGKSMGKMFHNRLWSMNSVDNYTSDWRASEALLDMTASGANWKSSGAFQQIITSTAIEKPIRYSGPSSSASCDTCRYGYICDFSIREVGVVLDRTWIQSVTAQCSAQFSLMGLSKGPNAHTRLTGFPPKQP